METWFLEFQISGFLQVVLGGCQSGYWVEAGSRDKKLGKIALKLGQVFWLRK